MKNINYNVLKLLQKTVDNLWRIEKHYLRDAKGSKCNCPKLLKQMQRDLRRQSEDLRAEVAVHAKSDKLS